MSVFDINTYRDGGSISFRVERNGDVRRVWLNTPLDGEPRTLWIDDVPQMRGDSAVIALAADLDAWWQQLPADVRRRIEEALVHEGPYYDADEATSHALDLSHIADVRTYLAANYR